MFPTIFALGLEGMGSYTKKASSYIVMGVAGGAFAPMLMGYIGADNMAVGFVIPLLSFLYILYLLCGARGNNTGDNHYYTIIKTSIFSSKHVTYFKQLPIYSSQHPDLDTPNTQVSIPCRRGLEPR